MRTDNYRAENGGVNRSVALEAGEYYPIMIEYAENTGNASGSLRWQLDGGSWSVIPTTNLFTLQEAGFDLANVDRISVRLSDVDGYGGLIRLGFAICP